MAKKIEPIYIIGAAGMVGLGIFFMLRKQSPDTASTPPLSTWWWYDMDKIPLGPMPVYTPSPLPPVDATLPGPVASPPALSPVSPPGVWPPMPYPVFPPSDPTIPGPGVDSLASVAKGGLFMGEVSANKNKDRFEQFRPKRARIYSYLLRTKTPSQSKPYGF